MNDNSASAILECMALNKCKTVIFETPYVDQNFLDSHSAFYSKTFGEIGRFTTRLHFFSSSFDERRIVSKLLPRDPQGAEDSTNHGLGYLGFSVVRPLPEFKIGRTVIAPRPLDKEREFILGHSGFPVNLSGLSLEARGFPFMQQDTEVSCCATAAIYMASKSIGQRFNCPDFSPARIMDLATRFSVDTGRPMPSAGITYRQILEALRAMNYPPSYFPVPSVKEARAILYSYLESEFPMILIMYSLPSLEGHAIVTVGHDLVEKQKLGVDATLPRIFPSYERGLYRCFARSEWVKRFFVHDDARGPYRNLSFSSKDEAKSLCLESLTSRKNARKIEKHVNGILDGYPCPVVIDAKLYNRSEKKFSDEKHPYVLAGIAVPLPPEITLSVERATNIAAGLLDIIKRSFVIKADSKERREISILPKKGVVLRPFLLLSNEFKRELAKRGKRLPLEVELIYKGMNVPKYIWLIEVYDMDAANDFNSRTVTLIGEIILDSTARPFSHDFIAIHILSKETKKGLLWVKRPNKTYADSLRAPHHIINDLGHSPLIRDFERRL